MSGLRLWIYNVGILPPFPVCAEERAEYLAFAKAVAVEAGLTTLSYFRTAQTSWASETKIKMVLIQ